MPVVLLATNRTWTSVSATELNDHILNDGIFEGPTYITRDEFGIPPDETFLYKSLNAHMVRDQTYSTNLKVATVLSRFLSHGYRIASQAGTGVGTSGKARYSADVSVTDYRWIWTLVREDMAPPPYLASNHQHSHSQFHHQMSVPGGVGTGTGGGGGGGGAGGGHNGGLSQSNENNPSNYNSSLVENGNDMSNPRG